jgi:hypothetical protein
MPCRANAGRRAGICLVAAVLGLTAGGCGSDNGPSYYEKDKAIRERSIDFLKERGATFTEHHYRQGDAWAVDLHGLTITDGMLKRLGKVGNITELNFSKSSLTDSQLAVINDRAVSGFLLKLDLSHTAVTDAGLEQLKDLGILSTLVLTGSKVTPAGVERFKKARAADERIRPLFKNPKITL